MLGLPQSTEVKKRSQRRSSLRLSGLNLYAVWENNVSSIGQFSVEEDKTLSEQIKVDEERAKLERQIAALKRLMNATKQPRRKRELFIELKRLKGGLNG